MLLYAILFPRICLELNLPIERQPRKAWLKGTKVAVIGRHQKMIQSMERREVLDSHYWSSFGQGGPQPYLCLVCLPFLSRYAILTIAVGGILSYPWTSVSSTCETQKSWMLTYNEELTLFSPLCHLFLKSSTAQNSFVASHSPPPILSFLIVHYFMLSAPLRLASRLRSATDPSLIWSLKWTSTQR